MLHLILALIVLMALLGAKPQYRPFVGLSFVVLFLFAALRYDFGNDYMTYYEQFQAYKLTGESSFDKETLYIFLNRVFPDFFLMIAFMSLLFVYSIWRLVKDHMQAEYIWTSLAILLINPYIFLMDLSAIRQTMALILFMCSVNYAQKKKIIPYSICIIMAAMFHKTAIVLLPVYFWANDQQVSRKRCIAICFSILFLLLSPDVLMSLLEKAVSYFDSANYKYHLAQEMTNSLRSVLLTGITLIYIIIKLPYLKGKTLVYTKLWGVGIAFNVLAYRLAMLTRLEMYFSIFSIVAFPLMVMDSWRTITQHSRLYNFLCQWVFPGIIIVVYLLRYYSFFTNPMWEPFFEYKTILGLPAY